MPDQKINNPFAHAQEDDDQARHSQDDGDEQLDVLDPAQQSLADALRVSFTILKALMVLLLIAYLVSGSFWVEEQERAVRLRFGAIAGEPGQQVYEPGWHFGLPYPIEQKIRVPVGQQTVSINRAYWYEVREQDLGRSADELAGRAGPLDPERDGSLLTGDANILHARFTVNYTITDPAAFVRNVGLSRPGSDRLPDGTVAEHPLDFANQLVRNVTEQGIIHAFARADADQVYRGVFQREQALTRIRDVMQSMETGITVDRLTMTDPQLPLPVRTAAQAVTNAENERSQLITEAQQERATILGEVAGRAHEPLLQLIRDYELALATDEAETAQQLRSRLDRAIGELSLSVESGSLAIGGEVARVINEARTYRTTLGQQIEAEVSNFQTQLDEYRRNPRIAQAMLWESAREAILSAEDVETFYLMPGQFYPVLNRDPELAREREERRLQEEAEQRRERADEQ